MSKSKVILGALETVGNNTGELLTPSILQERIKHNRKFLNVYTKGVPEEKIFELLTWSKDEFQSVARIKVYKFVLEVFEAKKVTPQFIRDYALREVLDKAKRPKSSSSPTGDLMAQYELAAWAEVAELLLGEVHGEDV